MICFAVPILCGDLKSLPNQSTFHSAVSRRRLLSNVNVRHVTRRNFIEERHIDFECSVNGGHGVGNATLSAAKQAAKQAALQAATQAATKSNFKWKLQADDIRHPLDRDATRLLSLIPFSNEVVRGLGNMASRLLYLDNVGSAVLVSQKQLPHLHNLLVNACETLNVKTVPQLYLRQSSTPNAYTLAIQGRAPFIVVTTSLLELLTDEELRSVLAHECTHLLCEHGIYLTAANILLGIASVPPMTRWLTQGLEPILFRWYRSAELTCDRGALLAAGGDPKIVVGALMKLAGGSPSVAGRMNVEAFLEQANMYEGALAGPFGDAIKENQVSTLTHPLPVLRAKEIWRWSSSPEFYSLLRKSHPTTTTTTS
mmetsp:Transcript_25701/g.42229  ORF Transcript_25701/g.42229 Transcript_25701/m.42229 type:complete len:369 (-) Transcript_25701:553-1659(-)